MSTKRYIQLSWDLANDPVPYYDEDRNPVTHATREEAQASADEDMEEYRRQVQEELRTEDEVPEPDEILPCTVNADGTVTLEDGTIIPKQDQ